MSTAEVTPKMGAGLARRRAWLRHRAQALTPTQRLAAFMALQTETFRRLAQTENGTGWFMPRNLETSYGSS